MLAGWLTHGVACLCVFRRKTQGPFREANTSRCNVNTAKLQSTGGLEKALAFLTADDRWLVGARLSLNDISVGDKGSLRISAWGKNLTDEEYREWGIDFASLGYAGNVFGQPRTYGVDLVYRFGN